MSRLQPEVPSDRARDDADLQPFGSPSGVSGSGAATWNAPHLQLAPSSATYPSIGSGGGGYGSADDGPQCALPSSGRPFGSSAPTLARRNAIGLQVHIAPSPPLEAGQGPGVATPTLCPGSAAGVAHAGASSPRLEHHRQQRSQALQRGATDASSHPLNARHSWSGEAQGLSYLATPSGMLRDASQACGPSDGSADSSMAGLESVTLPGRYPTAQFPSSGGGAPHGLLRSRDHLEPLLAQDNIHRPQQQQCPAQDSPVTPAARVAWRWLTCVLRVLRCFWPVPASALAFTLLVNATGYAGGWLRARPGTQAIFITSWLQCCWAVMSYQGRRTALRLTQLTAVLLGIVMLLPRGGMYGSRPWVTAFDEEGGLDLAGLAVSLRKFFGILAGSQADQGEFESLEELELHRALVRFQVSLAVMLVVWVLQAALSTYTLPAAASAAAPPGSGPCGVSLSASAQKSHLDLPTLDPLHPLYGCAPRPDAVAAGGFNFVPECSANALQLAVNPRCAPTDRIPGNHQPGYHRHHRALAAALASQWVLLLGACGAQCFAAAALIGVWDVSSERIALTLVSGVDPGSEPQEPLASTSWAGIGLLAAAMAAPLPLPSLLLHRMLHTALQLRPTASRPLGLLLLDVNASKLLLSVAVGLLVGWPAGAFTWQLLQVLTVLFGMARLHVDGVRKQKLQLHPGLAGGLQVAPSSPVRHGLAISVAPAVGACGLPASSARERVWGCGGAAADVAELVGGFPLGTEGGTCTPAAAALLGGGVGSCNGSSSINTMMSPCSSGQSLASSIGGGDSHGGQTGVGYSGVSPSSSAGVAHLARRPPLSGLQLVHQHQQPYDHYQLPHAPSMPCAAASPANSGKARSGNSSSSRCCCSGGLASFHSYSRAAAKPWSLLLASLSLLACMLWVALIAPPLAVLGDEPSDIFVGVMETAPGAISVLAVLAGTMGALVLSAGCLAWCAANGELRRRWRLDRVESRRLECLAWSCGPPLVVAAVSALSWALGDERNTGSFVVAEALRCAALWPLVWLQEPWLLGGVDSIGGCVQHVGCGVTCCVLRWCGLRPSSCVVPGGRCDVRERDFEGSATREKDCEGQVTRGASGRRSNWNLQVEVN